MPRPICLRMLAVVALVVGGALPFVARAAPALPGVGTPVVFPRDKGGGTVTITVTQVVDPFGALGGGTPTAGMRDVYVGLTVANGGSAPLAVDPKALFVVDAEGFVYRPSDRFGGAVQSVAPGASIAGGVVFAVPAGAVLTAVYDAPAPDRLILLALLGGVAPSARATAPPTPGGGTATAVTGGTGTPGADGAVDCTAFAPYFTETAGRIARLQAIGGQATDLVGLAQSDPASAAASVQGWASETTALATAQAQAKVPAGLGDLNDRLVKALRTYADAFGQLATGLGNFDANALQAFQGTLTDGDAQMTKAIADLNALADRCGLKRIAG